MSSARADRRPAAQPASAAVKRGAALHSVPPVTAPVREHVLRSMREAIINGVLAPGQRLVEASLCAQLGVSRPSVREALRQLEAERLVRIVPFKGPTVAEISWPEASEVYEVRGLLEGHAAYLFARRAGDEALLVMEQALTEFKSAVKRGDAEVLLSATKKFYDVILGGCENQVIADVLAGLNARINLLRSRSMSLPGRAVHSARELSALLAAIKARDPDAARLAAVNHVHSARKAAYTVLAASDDRYTEPIPPG